MQRWCGEIRGGGSAWRLVISRSRAGDVFDDDEARRDDAGSVDDVVVVVVVVVVERTRRVGRIQKKKFFLSFFFVLESIRSPHAWREGEGAKTSFQLLARPFSEFPPRRTFDISILAPLLSRCTTKRRRGV